MKRFLMASAIALLALLCFVPVASARGHVFVGGGFGFYSPRYYGWYSPGWYAPYWGPYYGPRYAYRGYQDTGKVKIVTHAKGDSIYVDGGYAGITGKLKKFPLHPGNHTIELRDRSGRTYYQERVEVIRGRTVEVRPDYKS